MLVRHTVGPLFPNSAAQSEGVVLDHTPYHTMGVLPSTQPMATFGSLFGLPLIWLTRVVYMLVGAVEGWGCVCVRGGASIPHHNVTYMKMFAMLLLHANDVSWSNA